MIQLHEIYVAGLELKHETPEFAVRCAANFADEPSSSEAFFSVKIKKLVNRDITIGLYSCQGLTNPKIFHLPSG